MSSVWKAWPSATYCLWSVILGFFLLCALPAGVRAHGGDGHTHLVSLLVLDGDSYLVNQALKTLRLPKGISVRFFTLADLENNPQDRSFAERSEVVIVDVMGVELLQWVLKHLDPAVQRIYALRGSRDDEMLRQRGLIFDDKIKVYFEHLSPANIGNLVKRVVNRELDPLVKFDPVVAQAERGIYHPDSKVIFNSPREFQRWYEGRPVYRADRPWVGLMLFSSNLIEGQRAPYNYLIRQMEEQGLNVMPCFGSDREVLQKLFLDGSRKSRVNLIVSFSLKFYSALDDDLRRALLDLNVPVLNAINLYTGSIADWRRDPIGIKPLELVWSMGVPEVSGLIEPTPLAGKVKQRDAQSGKTVYVYRSIKENVRWLIGRIKGWLRLQKKPNPQKRLAILYYNHNQGKQNISASYLNVFRSLEAILTRLQSQGYQTGETAAFSEAELQAAVIASGRNVGSWAPGELQRMLDQGQVLRVPLETYKTWFAKLPVPFRRAVTAQWGPPGAAKIMVQDGHFIIPALVRGNLVLLPEPARGWADAPQKLYHDQKLYPHHQYIAAYLWLKHGFAADAMIHLGTHATHEWLPGKQAGLAPSDSPEVLLGDLPNIYPYIVDNVGEGLQAKRRGRGVVIDHLVPPLTSAGLYHEYAEILEMIGDYNRAKALGSDTAQTQLALIEERIRETGIAQDFHPAGEHSHLQEGEKGQAPAVHQHTGQAHQHPPRLLPHRHHPDGRLVIDDALLHELEHYLIDLKATLMPYGMHTFGKSPQGEALSEMSKAIVAAHPQDKPGQVAEALVASGPREMDSLLRALAGGYVPPAEGNDPIRNRKAIPTGNNFFGFNPGKVPSRAAWRLGVQAAQQIIDNHRQDKGRYPQKVAVVLWATETIRNQGVSESTILYLLGLAPRWDRTGRVDGIRVISGRRLQRPRIDVLINPSGLYRDLFPHLIKFLDNAVRTAAAQTDVENFIAAHDADMSRRLRAEGLSKAEAAKLAAVRIFSEAPGSYGTGVSEVTSASSFWKSDTDIVEVYKNRVGFAFGGGKWGAPAKEIFRQNLQKVEVAVHSRSSQIYGLLDNDDMYQYLGGLSLAVKRESGKTPHTFIADQRNPGRVAVEDLSRALGREMRARYLNPRWIEGMKKENYAGAGQMAKFMDHMWGWQVTAPTAVDQTKWEQAYSVYVRDKYGLDLKEFFNRESPWAYQSLTGRMLEAVRKDYWQADDAVRQNLAVEYALNVIEKGVACCDHTCNNPFLNEMVVNLISLPGVMAPAKVAEFKLAIERAAAKPLSEQVSARQELQKALAAGFQPRSQPTAAKPAHTDQKALQEAASSGEESVAVEGYKLKDLTSAEDSTKLTSSGVQWFARGALMGVIALFVWGAMHRRKKM